MTSKGPPSRWFSFPLSLPPFFHIFFFDCLFCLPGYKDTDPHPHTKKFSKASLRMMDFKVGTNNSMQKGRSIKYKVNYYTRMQTLHPILLLYHSVKKRKASVVGFLTDFFCRLTVSLGCDHLSDSGGALGGNLQVCPFIGSEPSLCTCESALVLTPTLPLELEENRKEEGCLASWGFFKQSNLDVLCHQLLTCLL